MLSAVEQLYNQFHTTYLSSVAKWEHTTSAKKQQMLDSRSAQKRALNEVNNNILLLNKDLASLQQLETAALAEAEKQQSELLALAHECDQAKLARQQLEQSKALLAQEVAITQEKLRSRQAAVEAAASLKASQQVKNLPEWKAYSERLAWNVKTIKKDVIMFVFTHISDDWNEQFHFTVDVSSKEYKVVDCAPAEVLNSSKEYLDQLNESRDLFLYLKQMRAAFVEYAKNRKSA
ncbi:MAG: hypothetical protein SGCHY_000034 [Lobulomycetales sp.]